MLTYLFSKDNLQTLLLLLISPVVYIHIQFDLSFQKHHSDTSIYYIIAVKILQCLGANTSYNDIYNGVPWYHITLSRSVKWLDICGVTWQNQFYLPVLGDSYLYITNHNEISNHKYSKIFVSVSRIYGNQLLIAYHCNDPTKEHIFYLDRINDVFHFINDV